MLNLTNLLTFAHAQGASDLHLSTGNVFMRIDGVLTPVALPTPDHQMVSDLLRSVMSDAQYQTWQNELECDFVIEVAGVARFRVNAFFQTHGAAAVFRTIASTVPSLDSLFDDEICQILEHISHAKSGLVLVTGSTGSGKSTTLAAMVNAINRTQAAHILTIEDPIEYLHTSDKSLISQRQVGKDTHSFSHALRSALREDPDVILVGELRDLESIRLALTAAETGHLVLATLHTINAAKSIDRIIDVFDSHEKNMIRTMLADSLTAIIAQRLLPKTGGGRVAALEILQHTPAVANLIRENKLAQLPSVIQTGQAHGMTSLDQSLLSLVKQGKISKETANLAAEEMVF